MEYPLITNGAGPASKYIEQIKRILSINPCRGVVAGSMTLEGRPGNPEENFYYFEDTGTSINRVGLKNPGVNYYIEHLPSVFAYIQETKGLQSSVVIPSIAYAPVENDHDGIKAKELNEDPSLQFEILCKELMKVNPRMPIEVGSSCSNVEGSYLLYEDTALIGKIMEIVEKSAGKKNYTVKLGYMLPKHLNEMVEVVSRYDPLGIVAINTMPGLMLNEKGKPYLYMESKGLGGIGGRTILPFALHTVSKLREGLSKVRREDINIIGSGGISKPLDGSNIIRVGASSLQIGTEFMAHENDLSFFPDF